MFDWIVSLVDQGGLIAIAALMFLENLFPPLPSELIMPIAGLNAARGDASLIAVILAGSVGSLAGAIMWYEVGRRIGLARLIRLAHDHGRWFGTTPDDIAKAKDWLDRRGPLAVLFGRLLPAVRTLISVPAGIATMPFGRFLVFSTIGTVTWTTFVTLSGYLLEDQYSRVIGWLNPLTGVVVGVLVIWYVWRVATFNRRLVHADGASSDRAAPP